MTRKSTMTRRQVIATATLGSAGAIVAGCGTRSIDPVSEESLIASSALSGAPLSAERVHAQKPIFDFVMKEITLMREFDPGDEDPPAVFHIE